VEVSHFQREPVQAKRHCQEEPRNYHGEAACGHALEKRRGERFPGAKPRGPKCTWGARMGSGLVLSNTGFVARELGPPPGPIANMPKETGERHKSTSILEPTVVSMPPFSFFALGRHFLRSPLSTFFFMASDHIIHAVGREGACRCRRGGMARPPAMEAREGCGTRRRSRVPREGNTVRH
jgi:hypothetical protein